MNEQVGMGIWLIGMVILLVGYVMLLKQAFTKSSTWGCLMLVPPLILFVVPIFASQNWPQSKKPFFIALLGFGLAWVGVLFAGILWNSNYR